MENPRGEFLAVMEALNLDIEGAAKILGVSVGTLQCTLEYIGTFQWTYFTSHDSYSYYEVRRWIEKLKSVGTPS